MEENSAFELSEKALESISGGVLSDSAKEEIRTALAVWKDNGCSLEEAVAAFMRGKRAIGTPQELLDYANEVWDKL